MPVVRLILVLTLLATLVLLAAFVITRNRKYLAQTLTLLKFVAALLAILAVLYFMMRVLHF